MEVDRKSEAKSIRSRVKHLLLRRKFHEALELLTEAIKYFPRSYKLYRLRALAYSCLREYQLALQDAQMIIEIRPDCPDGYYQKGEGKKWNTVFELKCRILSVSSEGLLGSWSGLLGRSQMDAG